VYFGAHCKPDESLVKAAWWGIHCQQKYAQRDFGTQEKKRLMLFSDKVQDHRREKDLIEDIDVDWIMGKLYRRLIRDEPRGLNAGDQHPHTVETFARILSRAFD